MTQKEKELFYDHLRNLIEYILLQSQEVQRELEKEVIDNLNELHHLNDY